MKILVANLGSTSLKWRLFQFAATDARLLHKGGFERVADHSTAIEHCLNQLQSAGLIRNEADLAGIGFKTIMARGINGCVRLDERVLRAMEAYSGVAPAHNPPYINGIRLFSQRMPTVPLIGLFETAFYQWVPPAATRYAVPETWHELGVRRWGFHGASHKYIAERSAELLGRQDVAERTRQLYLNGGSSRVKTPELRIISCHLGGSSSVTGIRNGVAIGNSMGLSPQSGLPQNNRVGDLDAFAVPFVMRAAGVTLDEAERVLCKESGLSALSGGCNDVRDIQQQAAQGNSRAQLAIDVFVHQARHWIGAFLIQLNGADAVVLTGGMGENNAAIRRAVCTNLDRVGIVLDESLNSTTAGAEGLISTPGSPIKILVIPTNEELVVAREVKRFLDKENVQRVVQAPRQAGTKKPTRLAALKSKLASSK